LILALPETRDHHLMEQQDAEQSRRQETPVQAFFDQAFFDRAFSSEPVPFELSRSNGGCNAQIACYRDSVASTCFRVTAGSQPRRGGRIGQRTFEI
jgi:hypothetical protein